MADATRTRDDAPTLYERDFYLWCYRQAELLRLRRFAEADLRTSWRNWRAWGGATDARSNRAIAS